MRIKDYDIDTQRARIAFQLLIDRKSPIEFGNLSIIDRSTVYVVSSWNPENVTKARAISEFQAGRRLLSQLICQWSDLAAFFGGEAPCMKLIHDYGNGSVLLAGSPVEGEYKW